MGARQDLASQLQERLAGPTVYDHPRALAEWTGPVLMVVPDQVVQGVRPYATRAQSLAVWVVTHLTDPGPAEEALDELLDQVLDVLDDLPTVRWSEAERVLYRDAGPAYRITCEVETS